MIFLIYFCPSYHFESQMLLWCFVFHMFFPSGLQRFLSVVDLFVFVDPTFRDRTVSRWVVTALTCSAMEFCITINEHTALLCTEWWLKCFADRVWTGERWVRTTLFCNQGVALWGQCYSAEQSEISGEIHEVQVSRLVCMIFLCVQLKKTVIFDIMLCPHPNCPSSTYICFR